MGKNKTSKGVQQASTDHAPGQHGDKTTSRIAEISQTGNPGEGRTGPQYDPAELREHDHAGKNRLFEDRQQHDEADKNSEKPVSPVTSTVTVMEPIPTSITATRNPHQNERIEPLVSCTVARSAPGSWHPAPGRSTRSPEESARIAHGYGILQR